jgi:hypothetical protein
LPVTLAQDTYSVAPPNAVFTSCSRAQLRCAPSQLITRVSSQGNLKNAQYWQEGDGFVRDYTKLLAPQGQLELLGSCADEWNPRDEPPSGQWRSLPGGSLITLARSIPMAYSATAGSAEFGECTLVVADFADDEPAPDAEIDQWEVTSRQRFVNPAN